MMSVDVEMRLIDIVPEMEPVQDDIGLNYLHPRSFFDKYQLDFSFNWRGGTVIFYDKDALLDILTREFMEECNLSYEEAYWYFAKDTFESDFVYKFNHHNILFCPCDGENMDEDDD